MQTVRNAIWKRYNITERNMKIVQHEKRSTGRERWKKIKSVTWKKHNMKKYATWRELNMKKEQVVKKGTGKKRTMKTCNRKNSVNKNSVTWKGSIRNKLQHEASANISTTQKRTWKKYNECEWNMEKHKRIVHYSAGTDNGPCNDKLLCNV